MNPSDRNLLDQKNQEFCQLDELNSESWNQRQKFHCTREVALAVLEKSIINQLNILRLGDTYCYSDMDKISKSIFAWSGEGFSKRRALKNCVWIEVLKLHAKEDTLQTFKLQTDLREIETFLNSIFRGFQGRQESFDFETVLKKPLSEAERNLNIFEALCDESKTLKELLEDQKNLINEWLHATFAKGARHSLLRIEDTIINAKTCAPIKSRFEINWHNCKAHQAKFQSELSESHIQQKIEALKFKILSEEMSGDTIRDTYYALAEQYKNDIDILQNSFNIKLDDIDNKINHTRSEISKLVEQRNLLGKQIETFREEIEKRLVKEEKQRAKKKLQALKLEEEFGRKTLKSKGRKSTKRRIKKIKSRTKI